VSKTSQTLSFIQPWGRYLSSRIYLSFAPARAGSYEEDIAH